MDILFLTLELRHTKHPAIISVTGLEWHLVDGTWSCFVSRLSNVKPGHISFPFLIISFYIFLFFTSYPLCEVEAACLFIKDLLFSYYQHWKICIRPLQPSFSPSLCPRCLVSVSSSVKVRTISPHRLLGDNWIQDVVKFSSPTFF